MKLSCLIPPQCVCTMPESPGTIDVQIDTLLDLLWKHSTLPEEGVPRKHLFQALLHREKEHSTAIGDGVAFPHARILGIRGEYNLIATSKDGHAFNSLDGAPVYVFFLSLVPREEPALLLRSRAAFVRFLTSVGGAEGLLSMQTPEAIWNALNASGCAVDQQIVARDVMRPVKTTLPTTHTLRDAARLFHMKRKDTIPVVGLDLTFLGVLSCHKLFSIGLPDFFNQLHTISFVRNMNPFEKYFRVDQKTTVKDVMEPPEPYALKETATLMEMIFEMTVKNREVLYVVDATGVLRGVIDRFSIIDKILVSAVKKDDGQ